VRGQAIIAAGSLGYLPLNARELKTERARLSVAASPAQACRFDKIQQRRRRGD